MADLGWSLRRAGVAAVYLVDGSYTAPDVLRTLSRLARVSPEAAAAIRPAIRRTDLESAGDLGAYNHHFADRFASAINRSGSPAIPVRRFQWSCENHHLGRADGAVRLIHELASLELEPGKRILLWGHGHAGNVFALMTNLLGGTRKTVDRFFRAAEIYYRWPILGCVDVPIWNCVRLLLRRERGLAAGVRLDLVTFGTPVRYGWDSAGYSRLMHFVHHRPTSSVPESRASFPSDLKEATSLPQGDYIQQLGVAGTNVPASVFAWRARLADRRLERLLQSGLSQEDLLKRLRAGRIVPDEGATLLVDYGQRDRDFDQHHAGHAVYARPEWLLFHAEQVAERFYAHEMRKVA